MAVRTGTADLLAAGARAKENGGSNTELGHRDPPPARWRHLRCGGERAHAALVRRPGRAVHDPSSSRRGGGAERHHGCRAARARGCDAAGRRSAGLRHRGADGCSPRRGPSIHERLPRWSSTSVAARRMSRSSASAGSCRRDPVRIGGDEIDEAIVAHVKGEYSLLLGERTAEHIKVTAGSAFPLREEVNERVRVETSRPACPRRWSSTRPRFGAPSSFPPRSSTSCVVCSTSAHPSSPETSSTAASRSRVGSPAAGPGPAAASRTGRPGHGCRGSLARGRARCGSLRRGVLDPATRPRRHHPTVTMPSGRGPASNARRRLLTVAVVATPLVVGAGLVGLPGVDRVRGLSGARSARSSGCWRRNATPTSPPHEPSATGTPTSPDRPNNRRTTGRPDRAPRLPDDRRRDRAPAHVVGIGRDNVGPAADHPGRRLARRCERRQHRGLGGRPRRARRVHLGVDLRRRPARESRGGRRGPRRPGRADRDGERHGRPGHRLQCRGIAGPCDSSSSSRARSRSGTWSPPWAVSTGAPSSRESRWVESPPWSRCAVGPRPLPSGTHGGPRQPRSGGILQTAPRTQPRPAATGGRRDLAPGGPGSPAPAGRPPSSSPWGTTPPADPGPRGRRRGRGRPARRPAQRPGCRAGRWLAARPIASGLGNLGTSALTYAVAGTLAGTLHRPGPASWLPRRSGRRCDRCLRDS